MIHLCNILAYAFLWLATKWLFLEIILCNCARAQDGIEAQSAIQNARVVLGNQSFRSLLKYRNIPHEWQPNPASFVRSTTSKVRTALVTYITSEILYMHNAACQCDSTFLKAHPMSCMEKAHTCIAHKEEEHFIKDIKCVKSGNQVLG